MIIKDIIRGTLSDIRTNIVDRLSENEAQSEEDIRKEIKRSENKDLLDTKQVEMIEGVFEIDDISVSEILVPKNDVKTIPSDKNVSEIPQYVSDEIYTRYPIVDEDDKVIGFIDLKDVISADYNKSYNLKAGDISREIPVVPESTSVDKVLFSLQNNNKQMAAVIDEWGSLEGMVTIEDIVEVIFGELQDEFDELEDQPQINRVSDGYIVDGRVPIDKINNTFGTEFKSNDQIDTVAGLVLHEFGSLPKEEQNIEINNYNFKILELDKSRISKLKVKKVHT